MEDIMIDIEGFSLVPHECRVAQVAISTFDDIGPGEMVNQWFFKLVGPEWTVDSPDTIKWWESQKNYQLLLHHQKQYGVWHLMGMRAIADYIRQLNPSRVWFKHPTYDAAVLQHYFRVMNIKCPWNHRQVMDVSTFIGPWIRQDEILPAEHLAHDDVIAQIHLVVEAIDRGAKWFPKL